MCSRYVSARADYTGMLCIIAHLGASLFCASRRECPLPYHSLNVTAPIQTGGPALPADTAAPGHDGDLIRRARLKMVPALSIRRAAALTRDDPGNWGHVERGYQELGGARGRRDITHPPAAVLARMSSVVGVTPAQWEERGRGDVAELLREILTDAQREVAAVRQATAAADDAFLREIRNTPDLTSEQRAEYARLWSQGGREKVAEVAERMLRRPGS